MTRGRFVFSLRRIGVLGLDGGVWFDMGRSGDDCCWAESWSLVSMLVMMMVLILLVRYK